MDCTYIPGRGVLSGSAEVNHRFQSRGYWSNELTMPMKLASLRWGEERGERERERERERREREIEARGTLPHTAL